MAVSCGFMDRLIEPNNNIWIYAGITEIELIFIIKRAIGGLFGGDSLDVRIIHTK